MQSQDGTRKKEKRGKEVNDKIKRKNRRNAKEVIESTLSSKTDFRRIKSYFAGIL